MSTNHLPDGEKQNRCPRHHIYEDPMWWDSIMGAYNAYRQGILPHPGGTDTQTALFMPIMSMVGSSLEEERQIEANTKQRHQAMVQQSEAQKNGQAQGGKVSLMSDPAQFARITTPGGTR